MTPRSTPFLDLKPEAFGLSPSLSTDIALLDRALGTVLEQQADTRLIEVARRLYAEEGDADPTAVADRMPELRDPVFVQRLLRAYTLLFQLINAAEQKEIVRVNRKRHAQSQGSVRAESIAEAVRSLREAGTSAAEMQRLIDAVEVSPTLTAHPTEARRRSVLDKLQAIAHALVRRSLPEDAPSLDGPLDSRQQSEGDIGRVLTTLWQTDELRATPITVLDEVVNTLYFFERSLLDIVAWLHRDLRRALAEHYPGHRFTIGPLIRYCSWVGGDRDGNPNVSAGITWEALVRHKRRVLEHYIGRVDALRRELTQSTRIVPASGALLSALDADRKAHALPRVAMERYRLEPYALKLVYASARLKANLDELDVMGDFQRTSVPSPRKTFAYAGADEFLQDLRLIEESLRANRGEALADEGALADLMAQVTAFGFHLAPLDIRQHSDEHGQAVEDMLEAARILPPDRKYGALSEEEKV